MIVLTLCMSTVTVPRHSGINRSTIPYQAPPTVVVDDDDDPAMQLARKSGSHYHKVSVWRTPDNVSIRRSLHMAPDGSIKVCDTASVLPWSVITSYSEKAA